MRQYSYEERKFVERDLERRIPNNYKNHVNYFGWVWRIFIPLEIINIFSALVNQSHLKLLPFWLVILTFLIPFLIIIIRNANAKGNSRQSGSQAYSGAQQQNHYYLRNNLGNSRNYATKQPSYSPYDVFPPYDYQKRATNKGRMTGFEPHLLETIELKYHKLMFGTPGAGLSNSHFGEAGKIGADGELQFAKILEKEGYLDRIESYWSLGLPKRDSPDRDWEFDADVDCVLVSGDHIFLIDLKKYIGGDVIYQTYQDEVYCIDRVTGLQVGNEKHMSRNMENAQERYKTNFGRDKVIHTLVVLVPTEMGEPTVQNVYWPGNIPAVNISDFLRYIHMYLPIHGGFSTQSYVGTKIQRLLKK